MNQIKCAESVILEKMLEGKEEINEILEITMSKVQKDFVGIARKRLRKFGDSLFIEPYDLINSSISQGKLLHWIKQWTNYEQKEKPPLKYWLCFKFMAFCYDELRKRNNKHCLKHNPSRAGRLSSNAVNAMQMDEEVLEIEGAAAINLDEVLECLTSLEQTVLKQHYLQNKTLSEIGQGLNCHRNTVFAIKKEAEGKLRRTRP